jgi:hypothetical protein
MTPDHSSPQLTSLSLVFGVVYWAVWTRLLPRYRGYALVEEFETLPEGMTVTRLVKQR